MISDETRITYIGGPTALLEVAGLRFITDPTFDHKDSAYTTNIYTLHKLSDPLLAPETIGKIDYVLLSHDHHFDNLDHSGRKLLSAVDKVFTTPAGAERLGGNAVGIKNWETVEVATKDGRIIVITGTPCRHGPVHGDRGPVTGFVLNFKNDDRGSLYITGDTVYYEGVEEVAKRFDIRTVLLFAGSATVKEVGPDHLTMNAEEAVKTAKLFNRATIIPLHYEGWGHFAQSYGDIKRAFEKVGMLQRLQRI